MQEWKNTKCIDTIFLRNISIIFSDVSTNYDLLYIDYILFYWARLELVHKNLQQMDIL